MKDKLLYTVADYRKKRVIIDTDAACETDDPFAIAHALMSRMLEVKGVGAVTNVAKALILRPDIAQKMTIVTIGGNPYGCNNPGLEFNFGNDVRAANTILHFICKLQVLM